jgi:hypothetical protein
MSSCWLRVSVRGRDNGGKTGPAHTRPVSRRASGPLCAAHHSLITIQPCRCRLCVPRGASVPGGLPEAFPPNPPPARSC